jgi:hypothetical protein
MKGSVVGVEGFGAPPLATHGFRAFSFPLFLCAGAGMEELAVTTRGDASRKVHKLISVDSR